MVRRLVSLPSAALFVSLLVVPLSSCGGGGGGSSDGTGSSGGPTITGDFKVFAANDLGMHCIDQDFSTFSMLPPFNVVNAQVVARTTGGRPRLLGPAEVEVAYAAAADASGSVNSSSVGKTDFWDHVEALFGAALPPGTGLTGLAMPADGAVPGPQTMAWDGATGWFRAAGIPITPTDDDGRTNHYPLLSVQASSPSTGATLASLDVVVPVSAETECRSCHATGALAADDPGIGWSQEPDPELQARRNVLLLHDARAGTDLVSSTPVLCSECHYSFALDLSGGGPSGAQVGHDSFSAVMHAFHGRQRDAHGDPVFPPNGTTLETCYQCHPGRITECLRGAMKTGGLSCRECHGDMLAVGGTEPLAPGGSLDGTADLLPRRPWLDLPRCQSCHTGDALDHRAGAGTVPAPDGIRLMQTWLAGDPAASPILASNRRFAENEDTRYRDSTGHGGMACWACHGSPHAEWPNEDPSANDNVAAMQLQGHVGTITECATCHEPGTMGATLGGPHGMHPVDSRWAGESHGHLFRSQRAACQACHGAALEGTVLARVAYDRSFRGEEGSRSLRAGQLVRCDLCHSMPR